MRNPFKTHSSSTRLIVQAHDPARARRLWIALVLVWVRLQILHTGYDLSTARKLEIKLKHEQRELGLALATLTSPRRLEEAARGRLGMGPPAPGQVVSAP
jgi:cell division protein FtsL